MKLSLLCRAIHPVALDLLWDTIFFGTHSKTEAVPWPAFIRFYATILCRKQAGKPTKCRRLSLIYESLQHILEEEGMATLLKEIIHSLQPDELVIKCDVYMVDTLESLRPLNTKRLVIYIHAEEDLRILPNVLQACATSLTHLHISLGSCYAGDAYYNNRNWDSVPDSLASSGDIPELPRLRELYIDQCWPQHRVEDYAMNTLTDLLECFPDNCCVRIEEKEPWATDEGSSKPPWNKRLAVANPPRAAVPT